MRTNIKTTLLTLTLIAGTIWLAGCNKSSPSIIGAWARTGDKLVIDSNNIAILDSTFYQNLAYDTFAFYANGQCILSVTQGSAPYYPYKIVGDVIFVLDTISGVSYDIIDTIVSLTNHSLILSQQTSVDVVTFNNNSDTTIYTRHYTFYYSR